MFNFNIAWVESFEAPTLFQGIRFFNGLTMLNPTPKRLR